LCRRVDKSQTGVKAGFLKELRACRELKGDGVAMKYILGVAFCLFITAAGTAQDQGVIVCQEETSVTAWEKPGSLFVARQISCGETVLILGYEPGYVKIQTGRVVGYIASGHIKLMQTPQAPEQPALKTEVQDKAAQTPPKVFTTTPSQTSTAPSPPAKRVREPLFVDRWGLGVGVELSHLGYKEPGIMEESGIMAGVYGDYTLHKRDFMLKLNGSLEMGNVDYSSLETGTLDDIGEFLFDSQALFGRDLHASEKVRLTPFIGFGYRYLFDDMGDKTSSTGHGGYDRKSKYIYSPIGMEGMFKLGSGWSLGLSGEYDLFWHGWQYSRIGDVYPGIANAENDQKDGWGARGSVKLVKNLGKLDLTIEPFYKYWDIEQSEPYDVIIDGIPYARVWEPANNSREWGVKIGIGF
jgi:hypothetical protein